MRILFISANPHWQAQLDLAEELRLLMDAVKGRDVELDLLPAAGYPEVEAALARKPVVDIVHFSGYARNDEGILLRNDSADAVRLSASDLRELLERRSGGRVGLVVLNGNNTESYAREIESAVGCTIATRGLPDDGVGKAFTKYFYGALVSGGADERGDSMRDAHEKAVRWIAKSGLANVYTEPLGSPEAAAERPFAEVGPAKPPDREPIEAGVLRSWETYFYLAYLDDQIALERRWLYLGWIKFGTLLALGLVFAVVVTWNYWEGSEGIGFLAFVEELTNNVLKGGPLPALFAAVQQRLVAQGNDRLQSLTSLRRLVDSQQELSDDVRETLHALLDHSLRGALKK